MDLPAEKVLAINSMSVEQLYTVRAYFMLRLCVIKNTPLALAGVAWLVAATSRKLKGCRLDLGRHTYGRQPVSVYLSH